MKKRVLKIVAAIIVAIPLLILVGILFMNAFNWNHARPLLAKMSRSFTPYEVQVKGDWHMHFGRNAEIRLSEFAIYAKDYPEDAPPLFKSDRFFVRVPVASLFKPRKVVDRIELADTHIHLLRDENGKLAFLPPEKEDEPKDEGGESGGASTIPELNEIDVRNLAVAFEDRALKETASLSVKQIRSLAGEGIEPIHVQGQGRLEGQPFALNATWEDTSGKNKGPFDLALLLEIGKNRVVAEGKVSMDEDKGGLKQATVGFQADMQDPARLMRIAGIPSRSPVSFALGGKLSAEGEEVNIETTTLKTARSSVEAHGKVGMQERRPYADATVEVERFDMRDIESFLPPSEEKTAEAEGGGEAKPKTGPVFSREPINLDALHSLDAKVVFNVKRFKADNALAILQSARGIVRLENGDVAVALDDVGLGGGHLKANAALDTEKGKGMTVKTDGTFRDVALVAAAEPFDEKLKQVDLPIGSLLGGDLSGDFGLKTEGRSIHDLAANLDGAISFALEDGQLNAAALNLANLDIVDAVKAWFAKQRGLKVPCVLAYLPIQDGVIRSEGVYANPALGEILGDGYVDLGKETYDIRFATKGDQPIGSDVIFPLQFKGKFGGGEVKENDGKAAKDESIKEALPHAQQKSVQVEQTKETTGCTKELRERYLPARNAAIAH